VGDGTWELPQSDLAQRSEVKLGIGFGSGVVTVKGMDIKEVLFATRVLLP
jgi:hypothetical protein